MWMLSKNNILETSIASFVFLETNSLRVNNIDYVIVQALKNFGQQLYERKTPNMKEFSSVLGNEQ